MFFVLLSLRTAALPHKLTIPTRFSRNIILKKNFDNGIGCDMCQEVIKYIERILIDPTVESDITILVEELCTTFPSPYDSLCKNVVETSLPTILQWVEEGLDYIDICTKIGLCSITKTNRITKVRRKTFPLVLKQTSVQLKKKLASEQDCQACQKWFKWADDKLEEVTVGSLWKLISEECPNVPYLKHFCQIINEQNIETFASLILSALPPDHCCEWISFC